MSNNNSYAKIESKISVESMYSVLNNKILLLLNLH